MLIWLLFLRMDISAQLRCTRASPLKSSIRPPSWRSNTGRATKTTPLGFGASPKILFDRDGTVERLRADVQRFLQDGKKEINARHLEQLRFDYDDEIRYARCDCGRRPDNRTPHARQQSLCSHRAYFDVRQEWTPPPKQRLAVIRDLSPDLYALLCAFYQQSELHEKIEIAQRMLPFVFPHK